MCSCACTCFIRTNGERPWRIVQISNRMRNIRSNVLQNCSVSVWCFHDIVLESFDQSEFSGNQNILKTTFLDAVMFILLNLIVAIFFTGLITGLLLLVNLWGHRVWFFAFSCTTMILGSFSWIFWVHGVNEGSFVDSQTSPVWQCLLLSSLLILPFIPEFEHLIMSVHIFLTWSCILQWILNWILIPIGA